MAEPGKSEESQRTEAPGPSSRDMLEELVSHFPAGSLGRTTFHLHFRHEGEAPDISVDLGVDPAQAQQAALEYSWSEAREVLPSVAEGDVPGERDDAYYDELRRAVGRGTPSLLLGTSTRSLERGLRKLKAAQRADTGRPSSSAGSESAADLTEILRQAVASAKAARGEHTKKKD